MRVLHLGQLYDGSMEHFLFGVATASFDDDDGGERELSVSARLTTLGLDFIPRCYSYSPVLVLGPCHLGVFALSLFNTLSRHCWRCYLIAPGPWISMQSLHPFYHIDTWPVKDSMAISKHTQERDPWDNSITHSPRVPS